MSLCAAKASPTSKLGKLHIFIGAAVHLHGSRATSVAFPQRRSLEHCGAKDLNFVPVMVNWDGLRGFADTLRLWPHGLGNACRIQTSARRAMVCTSSSEAEIVRDCSASTSSLIVQ